MTIKKIESTIRLDTKQKTIHVEDKIYYEKPIRNLESSINKNIHDLEITIDDHKITPKVIQKEETTIAKVETNSEFSTVYAKYRYNYNTFPVIVSRSMYKVPLFLTDDENLERIELKTIIPNDITIILNGKKIDEFKDDSTITTMWDINTKDSTIIFGKYTRLSEMKDGIIIAVMYDDTEPENKEYAIKIRDLAHKLKKTIQEKFGEIDLKNVTIVQTNNEQSYVDTDSIITIPNDLFTNPDSDDTLLYILKKLVTPHMIPMLDKNADGFGFLMFSLPEYAIIPILDEIGKTELSQKILSDAYNELIELRKKLENEIPLVEINPNNKEIWNQPDMQKLLKLKGMLVLHMMRILAKDKGFFATIRAYNRRHKKEPATIEDFQYIAEANSHLQFGWFVQQWIYDTSMVKPNIEQIEIKEDNGKYVVSVEISNTGLAQMPIEIEIQTEDPKEKVIRTLWMTPDSNKQIQVTVKSRPTKIKLDPKAWVYKDIEGTIQEKSL